MMRNFFRRCRRHLRSLGLLDKPNYSARFQSRPSIRRLEERRVLNAEFMFVSGDALTLENFTNSVGAAGDEGLSISGNAAQTDFVLTEGVWSGTDETGVVEGMGTDTLSVFNVPGINDLTNGIQVLGSGGPAISPTAPAVTLGNSNLSSLDGPLAFRGIRSITQTPATTTTVGNLTINQPADFILEAINLNGNLQVSVDGNLAINDEITTSDDAVALISTGALTVNDAINAGANGSVRLVAEGNITQAAAGTITAGELGVRQEAGTGNIVLANQNNNAGVFAAFNMDDGGGISYRDFDALAIGELSEVGDFAETTGVRSSNGDVLINVGTSLEITQVLDSGNANVRIVADGDVTQTGTGTITANELGVRKGALAGDITLDNENNDVATFAALNMEVGGDISYRDVDALVIEEVSASGSFGVTTGVMAANGSITIVAGGELTVTNDVVSTAAGTITLRTTGPGSDIVADGQINAGTGQVLLRAADDIVDGNGNALNVSAGVLTAIAVDNDTTGANHGIVLNTEVTDLRIDSNAAFDIDNGATVLTNLSIEVDPTRDSYDYELASGGVTPPFDMESNGTSLFIENVVVGNVTLLIAAKAGDADIGQIIGGSTVAVAAAEGSIRDQADDETFDIMAVAAITLSARNNIEGIAGTDEKLDLADGSVVNASTSGAGDIRLRGVGTLNLQQITAMDGSIDVMAAGLITATNVEADGNVALDADAGDVTSGSIVATNGSVDVNADDGDVLIGQISAGTTVDVATPQGSILDAADDAVADITAGTTTPPVADRLITLTARDAIGGIGIDGKLDFAAGSRVDASTTTTATLEGDIRLRGVGALVLVDVDTVDGSIDVMATGRITATNVDANDANDGDGTTADISLMTTVGGIAVATVTADRNVTMNAVQGSIVDGDFAADDNDITAGANVTLTADNGSVGFVDSIFKADDFDLLEIVAGVDPLVLGNINAMAPNGSIGVDVSLDGVLTLTADPNGSIFLRSPDDLDVSGGGFTAANLAFVSEMTLTIADVVAVGPLVNLRLEGADVVTENALPELTISAGDLLFSSQESETLNTAVTRLDATTFNPVDDGDQEDLIVRETDGNIILADLDCDAERFAVRVSGEFTISAPGAITDDPASNIDVDNDATFTAVTTILLNDLGLDVLTVGGKASFSAGTITVGSAGMFTAATLQFNSAGTVTIQEDIVPADEEMVIAMTNTAGTLFLTSAGSITDADGTSIRVEDNATFTAATTILLNDMAADVLVVDNNNDTIGKASFSAGTITVGSAGTFTAATLQFNSAGTVTIQEDNDTVIAMTNTAGTLFLTSAGSITDADGTSIRVEDDATFTAATTILLNDTAADVLVVDNNNDTIGKASFSAGTMITVGSAGTFTAATLQFNSAGTVTIQEDNDTVIAMTNTAGTLFLTSAGSITDADGTSIRVEDNATFTAATTILLNDMGADVLVVDNNNDTIGKASFSAGTITVGSAGTFTAATLQFNSAGIVTIQEDTVPADEEMVIAMTNTAGTLFLTSAGSITDADGTSIRVEDNATFTAATTILLNDMGADVLVVDNNNDTIGKASFSAGTITVGSAGMFTAATLQFNSTGTVTIQEDNDTVIAMTNTAGTLFLTSAGSITDADGTSIRVEDDATFTAATTILLNDMGADVLVVDNNNDTIGKASFSAGAITVGSAGTFTAATLQFNSAGTVTIQEDNDTVIAMTNTAGTLFLTSAGSITDADGTSIRVEDDATFTAATTILLNDTAADVLVVDNNNDTIGKASFSAGTMITVGSAGTFTAATLQFNSAGTVTIQEDNDTVIAMTNTAGTLFLTSAGSITDEAAASLTVADMATFFVTSAGQVIILGDGDAELDLNLVEIPAAGAVTGNMQVQNVSLEEGATETVNPDITLLNVNVASTLFVTNVNSFTEGFDTVGNILQDFVRIDDAEMPSRYESAVAMTTTIQATNAGFQTADGAVILRNTEFDVLAVDIGFMPGTDLPDEQFDITAPNVADLNAIDEALNTTTLDNEVVNGLQPIRLSDDGTTIENLEVDEFYGLVVASNTGNLLIGTAVVDPAGLTTLDPGLSIAEGHAYLNSDGDVTFRQNGAASTVVQIQNDHVFTAVASGQLSIDTVSDSSTGAVAGMPTELTSSSGSVLSVGVHKDQYDGRLDELASTEDKSGPRLTITPPDGLEGDTTGLVQFVNGSATQKITLQVGVVGEENFFLDVAYADEIQELDEIPPGSQIPTPLVGERDLELDGVNSAMPGELVSSEFTVDNVFMDIEFFSTLKNPNGTALPTEVRLFNDPLINLFQNGGAQNLNRSISVLASPDGDGPVRQDNYVQPQMLIVPIDVQPEAPPPRVLLPLYVPDDVQTRDTNPTFEQQVFDQIRPAIQKEDRVFYGPVDINDEFEKSYVWEEGTTKEDFIQDIKDEVIKSENLSKYPPGKYVIEVIPAKGAEKQEIPFVKEQENGDEEVPEAEESIKIDVGLSPQHSDQRAGWLDAWEQWASEKAFAPSDLEPVTDAAAAVEAPSAVFPDESFSDGELQEYDTAQGPVEFSPRDRSQPSGSQVHEGTGLLVGSLLMAKQVRQRTKGSAKRTRSLADWWPK